MEDAVSNPFKALGWWSFIVFNSSLSIVKRNLPGKPGAAVCWQLMEADADDN